MISDMMLITAESYPSIFKAFETISHDSGNQAGHVNYAIPLSWEKQLPFIEHNLSQLLLNADGDFECLCIGDEDDRTRIVKDYKLEITDKLLQEFFEGMI